MNRAGMGRLSLVANVKTIDRKDVVSNSDVLIPVIKYLGCRVPVSQIAEHVDMFLNYARPKGKAPLSGHFAAYFNCANCRFVAYHFTSPKPSWTDFLPR